MFLSSMPLTYRVRILIDRIQPSVNYLVRNNKVHLSLYAGSGLSPVVMLVVCMCKTFLLLCNKTYLVQWWHAACRVELGKE